MMMMTDKNETHREAFEEWELIDMVEIKISQDIGRDFTLDLYARDYLRGVRDAYNQLSEENRRLKGAIKSMQVQSEFMKRAIEERDPVSELRVRANDLVNTAKRTLETTSKGGA